MDSKIGNIYKQQVINEATWEDKIANKYTGVIGRRYTEQHPKGRGMVDVDELDKPIMQEVGPFYYISRDTEWDGHYEEDFAGYKWFPKTSGWAIALREAYPYEDIAGSGLRFARWLPNNVQPYMKYMTKSRIFQEYWSTYPGQVGDMGNIGKLYAIDTQRLLEPDGRMNSSWGKSYRFNYEDLVDPLSLKEVEQDLLLWYQGQFIYNMFHHSKHTDPADMFQEIVNHFFGMIKSGLPDRYKGVNMGSLDKIESHFDMFTQVFHYRLTLNLKAMEDKRWSSMKYGNQPRSVTPGYKSTSGEGIDENDYPYFEDPERFMKDHQTNKSSHVDNPWDHI